MKYIAALTCLFLTAVANQAFALPDNDCVARSEKVQVTEREAFMKSCLAQAGTPAKVKEAKQQHKSARCEQNAKNMKLQGSEKGSYKEDCINKNEAVVAANTPPKNAIALADTSAAGEAKSSGKSGESHKAAAKKPAAKKQHKKSAKKSDKHTAAAAGAI